MLQCNLEHGNECCPCTRVRAHRIGECMRENEREGDTSAYGALYDREGTTEDLASVCSAG